MSNINVKTKRTVIVPRTVDEMKRVDGFVRAGDGGEGPLFKLEAVR